MKINRLSILKYFLFFGNIIFLFCLMSCRNSNSQQNIQVSQSNENTKPITEKLDLKNISRVQLSQDAKESTSDWIKFLVMKSEVNKFQDFTLKDLLEDKNNLAELTQSLTDSVPKKFDTIPVQARLNVLKTRVEMFKQYAGQDGVESEEVETHGREIYKAFANLETQLNELFIRNVPDFEFDMDRKQDSVLKSTEKKKEKKKDKDKNKNKNKKSNVKLLE